MGGRSGQRLASEGAKSDTTGGGSISSVEDRIKTQDFESAAVFLNGEQVFFKDGQKSSVSFTKMEVEAMKGAILTHNHPGGRSFSSADILLFDETGMKEIRAVSKGYSYSLSNDSGKFVGTWKLKKIIKRAEDSVRRKFQDLINRGEMDYDYARQNHHHEVNLIIAKETGFTYKRF